MYRPKVTLIFELVSIHMWCTFNLYGSSYISNSGKCLFTVSHHFCRIYCWYITYLLDNHVILSIITKFGLTCLGNNDRVSYYVLCNIFNHITWFRGEKCQIGTRKEATIEMKTGQEYKQYLLEMAWGQCYQPLSVHWCVIRCYVLITQAVVIVQL